MHRTTNTLALTVVLATAIALISVGCGNDGGSTGGAPSASTETQAPAAPAQPPPPPPIKSKILGNWDMPLEALAKTLPPEKRADVLTVDFVFREQEPTKAEVEASGIKGVAAFGIALLREEKTKNPNGEKIAKMRAAWEKMHKALPSLEVTANKLVLGSVTKRNTSTYTVLNENPQNVVLRVVDDDDGEVEELTFSLVDDNTLVISKPGDPDMMFYRHGVPRPAAAAQPEPPDLRENPAAARLLGRWSADSHSGSFTFQPDGTYVIHGGGGDLNGRWRVDSINGNTYVVRTTLGSSFALTSDTINIVYNDDGSITWTNTGTNSTSRYTKTQ